MDKDTFKKYGYKFIDWAADYFTEVEQFPVLSQVKPGEIRRQLPAEPPCRGESMDKIFQDFQEIVLPGLTHWQHPSWFAYFPANNSPASVLGELLTASIGVQGMVWQTSPAATELEEVVLEWLRQMLGLPEGMAGVIQDAASTATLCALLTAREKATNFEANKRGLRKPLVVYASEETHSSIEKGVKIVGYGKENLRFIPTDDSFAMIPSSLEERIENDKKNGLCPACVVATLGTTSSMSIDPLALIGKICRRHGIWLHVDAAFAGTAAILPEMKWMLEGAEYMDSFVFNPHKWMFTNIDCSVYFVRDPDALIQTFEIHPEYLKTEVDAKVRNFRDWGIQLGRRFRALKLWFVLRSYGVEGLQSLVRKHIRLAQMFKKWIQDHENFELVAPSNLSLVCFRFNDRRDEVALNDLNRRLLESLNQSGRLFLSHTILKGKYVLRMVTATRSTEERHVREAWELIKSRAAEMVKK